MTTKVKADRTCAAVAAASVLAKVHRDRLMIASDAVHPGYLWASNKGYASAEHYAAIDRLGPSAAAPVELAAAARVCSIWRRLATSRRGIEQSA